MKADAPFGRAQRDVVLHAVPGEHLDLAAVHLHWTRDGDLPLWPRQNFPDAGFQVEDARRSVELLEHGAEDRAVCRHGSVLVARARRGPARPGSGMKKGGAGATAANVPTYFRPSRQVKRPHA